MLRDIDEYVGKYYSADWVRKNVLMMSEDDIEKMRAEIEADEEDSNDAEDEFGDSDDGNSPEQDFSDDEPKDDDDDDDNDNDEPSLD
jgi:hypothetical protein